LGVIQTPFTNRLDSVITQDWFGYDPAIFFFAHFGISWYV
jgi:hypothetical protein